MDKVCSKCKTSLPIEAFWLRRDSKDGRRGICKVCEAERFRSYRRVNPEKYREISRRNYYRHQEAYCKANTERKNKARFEALTHYGGGKLACIKCGFLDIRALSLDHIEGGGKRHERERRATQLAQWLRKREYPKGYQTLCMNCQFIKKLENKEQITR